VQGFIKGENLSSFLKLQHYDVNKSFLQEVLKFSMIVAMDFIVFEVIFC
jgi:hypothetical protein